MEIIIKSLNKAINNNNWYVALFTALSLPDICGKIEDPKKSSTQRYKEWFDKYLAKKYKKEIGTKKQEHVFLSADDCYALRCAYLHEGSGEIIDQNTRRTLEYFQFSAPPESGSIHCNQSNNTLQLQIDIFCSDIIEGV